MGDSYRGLFDRLRIAVSSAKVDSVVRSLVGMSVVIQCQTKNATLRDSPSHVLGGIRIAPYSKK